MKITEGDIYPSWVLYSSVAGLRVEVADDHMLGGVGHQDGHAVDGRSFRVTGRRIDDVVGAKYVQYK